MFSYSTMKASKSFSIDIECYKWIAKKENASKLVNQFILDLMDIERCGEMEFKEK